MNYHELANIFPMMDESAFAELKADIAKNGQHEPIWIYNGEILDGRNRHKACIELEIEPVCKTYTGDSPAAFVWSLNGPRRHLTSSQKAAISVEFLPWLEAEAKTRLVTSTGGSDPRPSQKIDKAETGRAAEKAAAMTGTNRQYVSDAKRIHDEDPETFTAIKEGKKTISQVKSEQRRKERESKIIEISSRNKELKAESIYSVVYADPPWRYEYVKAESRAIENQYPTMGLDDIRRMPVSNICTQDAILFLWVTSPKLEEGLSVLNAWGFQYRTCAVWDKEKIGMGYYFRQQHELLLVGVRGSMPVPEPGSRVASVIRARRGKHSEKPDFVPALIETMYPRYAKVELFARVTRDGWDSWGNQSAA